MNLSTMEDLTRNNTNPDLFDRLRQIFGEGWYEFQTRNLPPLNTQLISYRDRGWVSISFRPDSSETDECIIGKYLSKLTFRELNSTDDNGASILHLAVDYDRGGQDGRDPSCRWKTCTGENIVKWLLDNPSFSQQGAQASWGNESLWGGDRGRSSGTALHKAFFGQLPRNMRFFSENHGGDFGKSFVARAALRTLLSHDGFMKSNANALNEKGLSALEYAITLATARSWKMQNIFFSDGARFDQRMDCAIGDYEGDYQESIEKLLQNKYLQIHRTFGVIFHNSWTGSLFGARATRAQWEIHRGLGVTTRDESSSGNV